MKRLPNMKEIRSQDPWAPLLKKRGVTILAHAEDSESPFVILRVNGQDIWLEDCAADVLINHIQEALRIMPSSK